jgi:hypothetical protein
MEWILEGLFLGVKWLKCEGDDSHLFPRLNAWSFTSSSLEVFMA